MAETADFLCVEYRAQQEGTTPKKNDEIGQFFDQKRPLFSLLFWFSSRKKMGTTLPLACIANCCYLCCCCGCLTFFRQFSWWWENLPTKVPHTHTHTFITGRTFVWNGSFVSKKWGRFLLYCVLMTSISWHMSFYNVCQTSLGIMCTYFKKPHKILHMYSICDSKVKTNL